MRFHVEKIPFIVGQGSTGVGFDVSREGDVIAIVQHEDIRMTVLMTPDEAEGWGVSAIRTATIARGVVASRGASPTPAGGRTTP